ncbi:hypothetical protein GCM10010282_71510 [Streptomyces roseolus]|nr:hypothetical protein GCM10010282_71510 [Streptomyces roseolus]
MPGAGLFGRRSEEIHGLPIHLFLLRRGRSGWGAAVGDEEHNKQTCLNVKGLSPPRVKGLVGECAP